MELKNLKKFKLNNSILKDFDSLMSMHLDQVEELTVSEIDSNSKLLNIIGLCINVKTLIIEGDQRINTNNVIVNLCKPEILESLILNNVKLPTGKVISRLTGIKLLSINNIRYNNVATFLQNVENPELLEGLNLLNVDFGKESVSILSRFKKLRYLNLINLNNYTLDKLDFLSRNRRLEKLNIKEGKIDPKEINKLIKGGYEKNISLEVNTQNKTNIADYFEIKENIVSLTLNTINLEEIIENVQLCKINKLILIIDKVNNISENLKKIKNVRNNISVAIKDVSYISKEEAILFEDKLCIKYINLINPIDDLDYKNSKSLYKIKDYIILREEIEKYVNRVQNIENEVEKFLKLYSILAEEIKLDNSIEEATSDISNIENALKEKKCMNNGYAEILQNCLACLNIESKIVKGKSQSIKDSYFWNKVKLNNKWYNVDLLLDRKCISNKSILKRKAKYCLLSDEIFYLTHKAESTSKPYSQESYDKKIINVYVKTGRFNDKLFTSYLKNITDKIIQMCKYNNIKALPAPKSENIDEK